MLSKLDHNDDDGPEVCVVVWATGVFRGRPTGCLVGAGARVMTGARDVV